MRKQIKDQLQKLLNMLLESHPALLQINDIHERNELLQNAQNTALSIGNTLEAHYDDATNIVLLLEKYCEKTFELSQQYNITTKEFTGLNHIIKKVMSSITAINATYNILFLPYKAAMWDSLESIWKAFKNDNRCSTTIMPIPYFEYNASSKQWEPRYEGGGFPNDIPIIDYKSYSLENELPDMIFVHNPYDNMNHVVSLHPDYLSHRIKQYTNCLVYVPYYVTSGYVDPHHLHLPIHQNMDVMIVQSEYAKEQYRNYNHYSKMVALGSPKIDRIIHKCKEKPSIPDEWESVLSGKKVIMLNTSINTFLADEEKYLKKIKHVCSLILQQENVALIWRPHPLLEATITSMRPGLKEGFNDLVKWFIQSGIGILDTTSDITQTVALSDAYIGEEFSSVINLFAAAGKPIYILNNNFTEPFSSKEKQRLSIIDIAYKSGEYFVTSRNISGLFKIDFQHGQTIHLGFVDGHKKWNTANGTLAENKNDIYITPNKTTIPVRYSINDKCYENLRKDFTSTPYLNLWTVIFNNKIFYLPIKGGILEYDIEKQIWKSHDACMKALIGDCQHREMDSNGYAVFNNSLWVVGVYTNRVLEFDLQNTSYYCIHYIGNSTNGYSAIAIDDNNVWLTETHSGNIIQCNKTSKDLIIHYPPKEYSTWLAGGKQALSHTRLFDMGNYLITLPGYANAMLRFNKSTGRMESVMKDFWMNMEYDHRNFDSNLYLMATCGRKLDNQRIFTQRASDSKAAIYNVEDDTYESFYPEISQRYLKEIIQKEDGFEKETEDHCFFRKESQIFTFEGFLDDLASGRLEKVKERQLQEMQTMAANMDGTCGQKVHDFMMEYIDSK